MSKAAGMDRDCAICSFFSSLTGFVTSGVIVELAFTDVPSLLGWFEMTGVVESIAVDSGLMI